MLHIDNYIDFCRISEGASVDNSLTAIFRYANNPTDNKEVLKTTSKSQHSRFFPESGKNSFEIRWGLDFNDYSGIIDHEGRIKSTMDQIKKGKYSLENLENFLKLSYEELGINEFKPDYVVRVGSTEKLASDLSELTSKMFNSKIIDLPKIKYENAISAIDWGELESQVSRQSLKTLSLWAESLFSEVIVKTNDNLDIRNRIKNAKSVEEARELLMSNLNKFELRSSDKNGKSLIPFIVRSSGKGTGGVRSFWLPKYKFDNLDFENSVIDCLDNNKKMLIIDDNENTGTDIGNICNSIDSIIRDLGFKGSSRSLFKFYVLYKMGKTSGSPFSFKVGKENSPEFYEIPPQSKVKSFEDFIRTGKRTDSSISAEVIKSEMDALNVFNAVKGYLPAYINKLERDTNTSYRSVRDIRKKAISLAIRRIANDEMRRKLANRLFSILRSERPKSIKYKSGKSAKLMSFKLSNLNRIDYFQVDPSSWTSNEEINSLVQREIEEFNSRAGNPNYSGSLIKDLKKKYSAHVKKNKLFNDDFVWPYSGKTME